MTLFYCVGFPLGEPPHFETCILKPLLCIFTHVLLTSFVSPQMPHSKLPGAPCEQALMFLLVTLQVDCRSADRPRARPAPLLPAVGWARACPTCFFPRPKGLRVSTAGIGISFPGRKHTGLSHSLSHRHRSAAASTAASISIKGAGKRGFLTDAEKEEVSTC